MLTAPELGQKKSKSRSKKRKATAMTALDDNCHRD